MLRILNSERMHPKSDILSVVLQQRSPRSTNGIEVLKRADNPSKLNTFDNRLYGTQRMLRWCLNVFEKIVVKHLHKSLKLHTSRRRRLRESIRCSGRGMTDIFCMTTHQHIDPNC
ncbi:hypothetical protein TNCV_2486721 [Trichonephila clavipes]|uniref:Uncharacterized protein n=1 Tax=Trichonephila clavipes TaxID=2585209 RepID=A0A8X6VZN8_TRICX|nr:hypothetical protein TNCV_2486721 [Trichonephila clavipes]